MSTRTRLVAALVIVVGIIAVLIKTAISQASTYYITVGELFAMGQQAVGEETAVSGQIVGSSVQWDPARPLLTFAIQDTTGGRTLPVRFTGDKPDDFSNGWPVIVFGKLNANGIFAADKLLIKCPSKYNAKGEQTYNAK